MAYQTQQMPICATDYGTGSSGRVEGWGGGMYSAMSPQDAYAELQQVRREDLARAAAAYGRY